MNDLIIQIYFIGLIIALTSGPLGCIILWKRIAYFGDSLAHASLLGVAFSLIFNILPEIGIVANAVLFSILIVIIRHNSKLNFDVAISILSPFCLALSTLIIYNKKTSVDLMNYLFGDILLVSKHDLIFISIISVITFLWLIFRWKKLIRIMLSDEIAISMNERINLIRLEFIIILALFISIAIKMVGVMLITSILIIPASLARRFSNNPESMAIIASIFGAIFICLGIRIAFIYNQPLSPTIIAISSTIFMLQFIPVKKFRRI
ncbi:MAG: metal ABC transporter permease [Sphingobacteriia bacterium]|nr:metal ABC transporter permease [Sphingobacteriia bacterium]